LQTKINASKNKINIKKEAGKTFIMCLVRKKWVLLTPEEKVRQFTVHLSSERLNYPVPDFIYICRKANKSQSNAEKIRYCSV
jgi:hypothetical protein